MGHYIYILRISDSQHTMSLHFKCFPHAHKYLRLYVQEHVGSLNVHIHEQEFVANEICDRCCIAVGKPVLAAFTEDQRWTASIARVPLYDNEFAHAAPCTNESCHTNSAE